MAHPDPQTDVVIMRLRSFRDRCDEIMDRIGDRRQFDHEEIEHLQQLLASLKSDLASAAKQYGGAGGSGVMHTHYGAATQEAAAKLTPKTNSHPIKSAWLDVLYDVRGEMEHYLIQLES